MFLSRSGYLLPSSTAGAGGAIGARAAADVTLVRLGAAADTGGDATIGLGRAPEAVGEAGGVLGPCSCGMDGLIVGGDAGAALVGVTLEGDAPGGAADGGEADVCWIGAG